MTPQDLAQNPLPSVVIPDPLTYVYHLDAEIERIRNLLVEKQAERDLALQYAITNNITEDVLCKLVTEKTTTTPNRVINLDKIQTNYPKAYERIWKQKRDEVVAELDKFGLTVDKNKVKLKLNQKIVESAMKAEGHKLEEALESGGLPTMTYSYSVVRK